MATLTVVNDQKSGFGRSVFPARRDLAMVKIESYVCALVTATDSRCGTNYSGVMAVVPLRKDSTTLHCLRIADNVNKNYQKWLNHWGIFAFAPQ
jgi:hypothetical protein